jgi:hypothetical protein
MDDGSDTLGACDPTCDPVTQTRHFDDAAACGSPDPSAPTLGCYGAPGSSGTFFSCAPVIDATKTHRADARINGQVYLNSCAPGYAPLLARSSADQTPVCIAFCRPALTHSGDSSLIAGAPPHTCPARGADAPEECKFLWWLEQVPSSYGNTVGFCFDPTQYLIWDHDDNQSTASVAAPSCRDLSNAPNSDGGMPEHMLWGCGPLP